MNLLANSLRMSLSVPSSLLPSIIIDLTGLPGLDLMSYVGITSNSILSIGTADSSFKDIILSPLYSTVEKGLRLFFGR